MNQPEWKETFEPDEEPVIGVLYDESGSMQTEDVLDPDAPAGSETKKKVHYPRFDIYYTHKSSRFSLSYVKQVEGVVCAGGICRLEPAFSGVKFGLTSTF